MSFGRLPRAPRSAPMSEINVTPLVDVMLVLLILFMLTAPLMSSSLKLDLPRAEGARPDDAGAVLALAIDAGGALFAGDAPISPEQLKARARAAAQRDARTEVHLRADQAVPYGRVAEVMGWVREAGLQRIGFVLAAAAPAGPPPAPRGR